MYHLYHDIYLILNSGWLNVYADAERQAAVRAAMFVYDHESVEYGQREVCTGCRRLHARTHLRTDQVWRDTAPLQRPVCQRLLREAADRRRAVLVDAVRVGD